MSKFTEDINKMLSYIGVRRILWGVSHCATRLRFVLKDPEKAI